MQNGTPRNPVMDSNQDWRGAALCGNLSPEEADSIFFIGPGKSSKRAQLFCKNCPVKKECSTFSIVHNEEGIWAGQTDDDRSSLDPFIKHLVREEWTASGHKIESRNINDFIPPANRQQLVEQALDILDQARLALDDAELLVELLEAPDLPFDNSNVLPATAL